MGETLRSGCPIQARAHRAKAISITFRDGSEPFPSPNPIRNQPLPIDLCDCSDPAGHVVLLDLASRSPVLELIDCPDPITHQESDHA